MKYYWLDLWFCVGQVGVRFPGSGIGKMRVVLIFGVVWGGFSILFFVIFFVFWIWDNFPLAGLFFITWWCGMGVQRLIWGRRSWNQPLTPSSNPTHNHPSSPPTCTLLGGITTKPPSHAATPAYPTITNPSHASNNSDRSPTTPKPWITTTRNIIRNGILTPRGNPKPRTTRSNFESNSSARHYNLAVATHHHVVPTVANSSEPSSFSLEYTATKQLEAMVNSSTSIEEATTSIVRDTSTTGDQHPEYQLATTTTTQGNHQHAKEDNVLSETFMESMILSDFLTITMPGNIEKISNLHPSKSPKNLIEYTPRPLEERYVILIISTLQDNLLPAALYNPPHLLMHLELSVAL